MPLTAFYTGSWRDAFLNLEMFPMSIHQTATFQEAPDIVESLPEDQQETLVAIVRHRLIEHARDVLSKHIEEAREELSRGEVRRGTVDDLMKELPNENAHLG